MVQTTPISRKLATHNKRIMQEG